MPWFLIMIEGGPIDWPRDQTSVEQRIDRVGFFTTPKVHANSEQRAITLAIDEPLPNYATRCHTVLWLRQPHARSSRSGSRRGFRSSRGAIEGSHSFLRSAFIRLETRQPAHTPAPARLSSVIISASPTSIIVFGRENNSLSAPPLPDAIDRLRNNSVRTFSTSSIGSLDCGGCTPWAVQPVLSVES
jgi:hypothetical protein